MTKNQIECEQLKISQNGQISGFWIFNFPNSNFFVIFGFPSKQILFLGKNIFVLPKTILNMILQWKRRTL
jgi:hypothetical protein